MAWNGPGSPEPGAAEPGAAESVIIKVSLDHAYLKTGFLDVPVIRNGGQTAEYLEKSAENVFCYHLYGSVNGWMWEKKCNKSGILTSSETGGEKDNYRFSLNCNGLIVDIALTYNDRIFTISLLKHAGDDSTFRSLCSYLRRDLMLKNEQGMGGRRTRRNRRKSRRNRRNSRGSRRYRK